MGCNLKVGQRVQTIAKRLAASLMQGTIPQSDAEIEVTVVVTIRDAGCVMNFSASEVLVDEDEYADGRDLSFLVSE